MTPRQLYTAFRSDVVDAVEPYLWSDVDVWGYMDDAQKMFCRLTGGLRDVSSRATIVEVSTGDPWAPLHESVMWIRHAELESTGESVHVYSYEDVVGSNGSPGTSNFTTQFMSATGPVKHVIIGMEEGKLRTLQVPLEDDRLILMIERLPLCAPAISEPLEIRSEHHRHLLLWMEHLAFAKQDSETLDEKRSAEKELAFRAYCAGAKSEKERRERKPRLIVYGGY